MSTTAVYPKCRKCGLDVSGTGMIYAGSKFIYHPECAPHFKPMTAPIPSTTRQIGETGDTDERPDWPTVNATYEKWKGRAEALEQRVVELTAERDTLQEYLWALELKVESLSPHETCACSWDRPDDLCMHHSPKLAAAEAQMRAKDEALTVARKMIQTREYVDESGWGKGSSPATRILAKIDAALAPVTTPPAETGEKL